MKTKIFSLILATAGLMASLTACHEGTWNPAVEPETDSEGQLSLASLTVNVAEGEQLVESRAGVDASNFIVKISGTNVNYSKQYTYSEMPEIITLPVGEYKVEAYSHEQEKAAWSAPYYVGSKAFSILENEITEIGEVTCKFANIKVTIRYSEAMKHLMGDDCTVTVVCNDEGSLTYTKEETRSGYFQALEGSSTLVATFNGTVGGSLYTDINKIFTDIEAGQHRIITFNVKSGSGTIPDEYGTINPSTGLIIDAEIIDVPIGGNVDVEEDPIQGEERPGKEEPLTPPVDPGTNPDPGTDPTPGTDPSAPAASFSNGAGSNLDFNGSNPVPADAAGYKAIVIIDCPQGVKNLNVNIASTNQGFMNDLPGLGVPLNFDLANPKAGEEDVFAGFGFPYGADVTGKTAVTFDISQFIPLLNTFAGTHTFTLTVVDNKGASSDCKLVFVK